MVVRAHNGNVRWQCDGETVLEKNKLLPCWIVECFLVGNAYKTDTY